MSYKIERFLTACVVLVVTGVAQVQALGTNSLISTQPDGTPWPSATENRLLSFSSDGRYVLYAHLPDPMNNASQGYLYLMGRDAGTTELVSKTSTGTPVLVELTPGRPALMSDDGATIVYGSVDDTITGEDNNPGYDLFVYNNSLNTVKRFISSGWNAFMPIDISADGRYVLADGTPLNSSYFPAHVRLDLLSNMVERVNTATEIDVIIDGAITEGEVKPVLTPDGRYVAFCGVPRTGPGSPSDTVWDDSVYVRDFVSGVTEKYQTLSVLCPDIVAISDDGRYVSGGGWILDRIENVATESFPFVAGEIISASGNGRYYLFFDAVNNVLSAVDISTNTVNEVFSFTLDGTAIFATTVPSMAFVSSDSLVAADTNLIADVYTHDIGAVDVINVANAIPVLDPVGDQVVNEDQQLTFTLQAVDADGDPLTFSAYGLPKGATLDSVKGVFSWTPDLLQSGVYELSFYVSDNFAMDFETIWLNVTDVNGNDTASSVRTSYKRITAVHDGDGLNDAADTCALNNSLWAALSGNAAKTMYSRPDPVDGLCDLLVQDVVSGLVEKVNFLPDGTRVEYDNAMFPVLSRNGGYVTFRVTDPVDGSLSVYTRDLANDSTLDITGPTTIPPAMGVLSFMSTEWDVADVPRYLMYEVAGTDNINRYFTHDRMSETMELVSIDGSDALIQFETFTWSQAIMYSDHRFVLMAGSVAGVDRWYLRDRHLQKTKDMVVPSYPGVSNIQIQSVDGDGRIALISATNDTTGRSELALLDTDTGSLNIVPWPAVPSTLPTAGGPSGGFNKYLSLDGRYVAYNYWDDTVESAGIVDPITSTLLPGGPTVFVYDRISGITERACKSTTGGRLPCSLVPGGALTRDGQSLLVYSKKATFVEGDVNDYWDLFLHSWVSFSETTAVGDTVSVSLGTDTEITFDKIDQTGETSISTVDAALPAAMPSGFSVGNKEYYYEITTTASYTGSASVCVTYDPTNYQTEQVSLFHWNGSSWDNITTGVDTVTNQVCGTTTSFSPFVVGEPEGGGESSTAITLDSFNVTQGEGQALIQWTTLSEVDNYGFRVLRSESQAGEFAALEEGLIPALGGPGLSMSYSYVDATVESGKQYYYRLQDIDTGGLITAHAIVPLMDASVQYAADSRGAKTKTKTKTKTKGSSKQHEIDKQLEMAAIESQSVQFTFGGFAGEQHESRASKHEVDEDDVQSLSTPELVSTGTTPYAAARQDRYAQPMIQKAHSNNAALQSRQATLAKADKPSPGFAVVIEDSKGNVVNVSHAAGLKAVSVKDGIPVLGVDASKDQPVLNWQAQALTARGFIVLRAEKGSKVFAPVVEFVPNFARGETVYEYHFTDASAKSGKQYQYRLELSQWGVQTAALH